MRGLEPFWLQHDRVWVTDLKKDTEVVNGKEKTKVSELKEYV